MKFRTAFLMLVFAATGSIVAVTLRSSHSNAQTTEPKSPTNAEGRPTSSTAHQPIGGRWYLELSPPNRYLYDDGTGLVDLFSYHIKDSNKDGIPNLKLSHDARFLIIESQGYPNHPTAVFPNSSNPNSIRVQNFVFRLPLVPKEADEITRLPMGPIGTAINGVVFFNPFEMGGMNAVEATTRYGSIHVVVILSNPAFITITSIQLV